jgi:hypothetical protein
MCLEASYTLIDSRVFLLNEARRFHFQNLSVYINTLLQAQLHQARQLQAQMLQAHRLMT